MSPTEAARRDLEWSDLAIILAIGRAGSLSGAARALGKTYSTIFRNISAIEEKAGVRFFDRFDNGYVPTDAGRTALVYAERVEGEFHALSLEVLGQDTKLRGPMRVTCPEAFASDHMPGLAARFVGLHPEIQIEVSPGHGAVDLNKREAEVAIRATRKPPETSFGRKICPFRFALYGSAPYLEAYPDTPLGEHAFCLIETSLAWLVPVSMPLLAPLGVQRPRNSGRRRSRRSAWVLGSASWWLCPTRISCSSNLAGGRAFLFWRPRLQ